MRKLLKLEVEVFFLQLAAEKKTPFLVLLKQVFSPSYFVRALQQNEFCNYRNRCQILITAGISAEKHFFNLNNNESTRNGSVFRIIKPGLNLFITDSCIKHLVAPRYLAKSQ